MASLIRKVKTALDENRLLILGAQVLFGFQLQVVFQDAFAQLPLSARRVDTITLALMALTLGLLIAPSMQHRLVEGGHDTCRIHRVAGMFAGAALLPFGASLWLDIFMVVDPLYGSRLAAIAGGCFFVLAIALWFAIGLALRFTLEVSVMPIKEEPTPLPARIDQMLTEARVIVPGAQALLGFQLVVMFTRTFGDLTPPAQATHVAALCCVAIAVVLLMTPAALHRIAFRGEDTPAFLTLGSGFVIAAPMALAFGIAADMYVAIAKATGAREGAAAIAATVLVALIGLWYGLPLWLRGRRMDA
jgi:hypothetical protein